MAPPLAWAAAVAAASCEVETEKCRNRATIRQHLEGEWRVRTEGGNVGDILL